MSIARIIPLVRMNTNQFPPNLILSLGVRTEAAKSSCAAPRAQERVLQGLLQARFSGRARLSNKGDKGKKRTSKQTKTKRNKTKHNKTEGRIWENIRRGK